MFFEGNGLKNDQTERGKSKKNRTDCPLVSRALFVDNAGFPAYSKILPGNQSEPATLKDVLEQLEGEMRQLTLGQRPTLIMDRGNIASRSAQGRVPISTSHAN